MMNVKKKSLVLAVVATVLAGGVCQNVWAEDVVYKDATTIKDGGTYNFKSGSYTGDLIDYNGETKKNGYIIINIEDNKKLEINKTGSWAILDIYAGNGIPNPNSTNAQVKINGNLDLKVDCDGVNRPDRNDARVINLLNNNDSLTINGDVNIVLKNLKTKFPGYWAEGIRVYSGTMQYNGNFTISEVTAGNVGENGQYGAVTGVYSTTTGDRIGSNTSDTFKSNIVLGKDSNNAIKIQNITAKSESGDVSTIGIYSEGKDSIIDINGSAEVSNIYGETQNAHAEVIGIAACDNGVVNVKGDLTIANIEGEGSTNEVVALQAWDGGVINVNADKNVDRVIKITGDIDGGESATGDKLIINMLNKDSYLEGASTGNVEMELSNGATWIVKDRHLINDPDTDKDIKNSHIHSLTGNGGVIQMDIDASKNTENQHLFIDDFSGEHTLKLNNIGNGVDGAKDNVLASVNGSGKFIAPDSEGGLYWTKYELGTQTSGETGYTTDWYLKNAEKNPTNPTTSVSTLLSTVTAGYDTWRNDTDKFNERMGELRLNGAANEGVWVRTKGSEFGRHGGNGSYTNKQQTYQLGYDAVTSKDDKQTTYTGVAAEYSKGNLSFDSGTGTMKSMGLGVYQTKVYESGHYLDLVGKFDKYKNDFHVTDTQGSAISGKYGNNALSLSAEYGRKNALKDGWYVEPQSEVTLGYMFGNDFTTSNNIRVEQKNMPALIGRLGLNVGREVSDKVNFYVKASINHDFLGNYDVHMTDLSTGDRLNASDRFGSSWFDYGAGVSVKTGKDSYAYFDIERAVGGEYKKNWDWNAGVRWSF